MRALELCRATCRYKDWKGSFAPNAALKSMHVNQSSFCSHDSADFQPCGAMCSWVSSEMDGTARSEDGTPRPRIESKMTCAEAVDQNKVARVYLGVHWHFDCVLGAALGQDIADKLVAHFPARA